MHRKLNPDSVLPPLTGTAPKALVMLLHGVGANGEDLMSLAEAWQATLPDAVFVSPNAPDAYDGGFPDCYQWFSLEGITPENRLARVLQSAPVLNEFIDEQLTQYRLTDNDLILVGFSQGTIMALSVALRRQRPCAGLLGYSGRLAGPESIAPVTAKPRTLLLHGTQDEVIPITELYEAEKALKAHDVPVVAIAEPGISHDISQAGEALGAQFIQYCLETRTTANPDDYIRGMSRLIGWPVR